MIKVAVLGSAGRMGKALIKGIADSKSLALCSAIDKPGLKLIGEDSGLVSGIEANGILVCDSFSSASGNVDVVIDFTSAKATLKNIETCLEMNVPIVIGTTGLGSEGEARLKEISAASQRASANMQKDGSGKRINAVFAAPATLMPPLQLLAPLL